MKLLATWTSTEIFFLICAVTGGLFVLIRLVLQMVGMDHPTDGGDFDAGGHDIDAHHDDSDVGFKLLSLQGLSSFLMMFGLVGIAMYRGSRLGLVISTVGAVAAGLGSVWVIGKLFALIIKLQSSGTISMESTMGAEGKVYLTIPPNATGRVLITVNDCLREFDAKSADDAEIKSDVSVRVVWVEGNVLVVERK